ncbi:MAG: hypothetical protein JWP57_2649 [Spirosoma sp.]|nr:hypothetical protein [Spirosoma sp.]
MGTVSVVERNVEGPAELTEAVGCMARNEFSACPDGTESSPEIIIAKPVQLFFNEVEVESNVMSDKNGILRNIDDVAGNIGEDRRISHHGLRNTGQMSNKRRNRAFWIEQRME